MQYRASRDSVSLIHKGNIQKFTEGAFKDWIYELAAEEFGGVSDGGPWMMFKNPNTGKEIIVNDVICDAAPMCTLLSPLNIMF